MSDTEKTNHWRALAEELGTESEPPKDSEASAPPAQSPPESKAPRRAEETKRAAKSPRRPQPSNWSDIGRELGVEDLPTDGEKSESPARNQRDEPTAKRTNVDAEEAAIDSSSRRRQEPATARVDDSRERSTESDPSAAAGVEQSKGNSGDSPPRRRRRRRRRPSESEAESAPSPAEAVPSPEGLVEADLVKADAAYVEADSTAPQNEEKTAPRRRRRRRGRGKKSEETADSEKSTASEAAREVDEIGASTAWLGEDQPPDMSGADEPESRDEELQVDESSTSELSSGTNTPREKKASHRSIPTWQEAIGTMITANIEARGTGLKAASASPNSRGGRRGRGGRRRKASGD